MSDGRNFNDLEQQKAAAACRQAVAPSPIINAAMLLGLNPLPTGENDGHWLAECPCTGHKLSIWPDTDVWNCSECSCGGDIDDLEALWRDRRRQAA